MVCGPHLGFGAPRRAPDREGQSAAMKGVRINETWYDPSRSCPRFRRWWWNHDTGKVMMEVRYGNKPLELQPGKPTIEIGEKDNPLPVLSTRRQGIVAGALDKVLMDAKKARPGPKRKAARM